MTIGILGWGSLVWDPRALPHYGPWARGGPVLPIEFSRVSGDGRLTLVLDPKGTCVETRFALSPRSSIHDAVADLRSREGTTRRHIGFVLAATDEDSRSEFQGQFDVTDPVRLWCLDRGLAGCVWTALPPNFAEETGEDFSPARAVGYLAALPNSLRGKALQYIRNAPGEVETPARKAVRAKWP